MAAKKSVHKGTPKKSAKSKTATKKTVRTKSKKKPSVSKSPSAKKKVKGTKAATKKKQGSKKTQVSKKKTLTRKTGSKKAKSTLRTKSPEIAQKSTVKQKTGQKKAVRKKSPSVKTPRQSDQAKKRASANRPSASRSVASQSSQSDETMLSPTERYNIGGLFACAIQRERDPDFLRLRAVLRYLGLSSLEKDNLIRLSQGFMIPKLFTENLTEPKVTMLLTDLMKFGKAQKSYENYWREEIQQIGFWLGVFPAHFLLIEQQVKR